MGVLHHSGVTFVTWMSEMVSSDCEREAMLIRRIRCSSKREMRML